MHTTVVTTPAGAVEIAHDDLDRPAVLVFPGGHCDAHADLGWAMFRDAGYAVVSVSRPGYGKTNVGDLTAAEFVEPLSGALTSIGITELAAVVGISFGGLSAVEFARLGTPRPTKLILASAAPSSLPYPDTRKERLLGPIMFHPRIQSTLWRGVRRMISSDRGLKIMCATFSTHPIDQWWDHWSDDDRRAARELISGMSSGTGFVNDLRQATRQKGQARAVTLMDVDIPTLVLASRHDGAVDFAHAEVLSNLIPDAQLVETGADSHLYFLGPEADGIAATIRDFLD